MLLLLQGERVVEGEGEPVPIVEDPTTLDEVRASKQADDVLMMVVHSSAWGLPFICLCLQAMSHLLS
jgi:hypothetical protein